MKSTLLTTTALIAFAGASYADGHTSVGFSGKASAEYNSETGFSTETEVAAAASAQLDNGLTASASLTFKAVDNGAGAISAGSVSLSSDTASLTFGTGMDGAAFTAVGGDYAIGAGEEGLATGVVGTYDMGAAALTVSTSLVAPTTDDLEVGVTTTAGAFGLAFGVSGAGDFAATVAGTAGGADLNFGMSSNDEWDAGLGFTAGAVSLSASTDENSEWTIGADYDGGDFNAGIEYNSDESWKVSAGYAAGAVAVAASLNSAEVVTLGATYDMGNGLTLGGGIENATNDAYAFADYSLGGGASAYAEYGAVALTEVGPSERDIALGTTVGVSFTF